MEWSGWQWHGEAAVYFTDADSPATDEAARAIAQATIELPRFKVLRVERHDPDLESGRMFTVTWPDGRL